MSLCRLELLERNADLSEIASSGIVAFLAASRRISTPGKNGRDNCSFLR